MNGHVLEELPIAIDCFKDVDVQLYFLTHAHSDHTVGLTKSWMKSKIYCTEVTAKLTAHRLGVRYSWFDAMTLQQEYIFKVRSEDDWTTVIVTALPANHCPGSCMFLLQTSDIKILYTGDFKPNAELFDIGKTIWGPRNRPIDVMYVDNTYADKRCVLPSQKAMVNEIIGLCNEHKDCTIFIGVYWTGHEDLLTAISSGMNQPIVIKPEQMAVLRLLGDISAFTTDKFESDLHALPMHQITKRFMREINETENSIAIIPTGRMCDEFHTVTRDQFIYWVPFSHHPSCSELQNFLSVSKPSLVKPIVEGKSECRGMGSVARADMSQFRRRESEGTCNNLLSDTPSRSSKCYTGKTVNIDNRRRKPRFARGRKSCKPLGVVFED